jgi:hypothetical protein
MPSPAALVRRLGDFFRAPAGSGGSPASAEVLCTRLFWAWLVVRTVAWFGFAAVAIPNPPLDLVEWLSWGHSLEWGYPKHPPLPAWLAAGFARLSPGGVWGVYLLAYLTAAACIWAAWRLAREYLPPPQALLAALCLEGSLYLTNDPAEWSNNVALDLGWALVILFAYRAIRTGSTGWWAAAGLATGLALLCKYTVGVVLLPLAAYLVIDRDARRNLRRPGPYVAAAVAAAVFAPHLAWLVRNDFITLTYASERSADVRAMAHLRNPAEFVLGQTYHVIPILLVLYPALWRRRESAPAPAVERRPGLGFLHAVVLGPAALLLLLSAATGCLLREIWGSPLWTFLGVWALATFRGGTAPLSPGLVVRRAAVVAAVMLAVALVRLEAWPYISGKTYRQQYPGRQLSDELNRRWSERYDRPFPIVAGEAWAAGNVCVFSPQRPVLYSSGAMGYLVFEPKASPWTNDDDLNARGGVVLWDANQLGDDVPIILRHRLPRAVGQPAVVLPYQTGAAVPPARVGVAFVPPGG